LWALPRGRRIALGVIDMPRTRASILLLSAILSALLPAGCASPYRVVRMPQREADLYPLSQTKDGITVAIDQIQGAARAERYFGADLIKAGIVPVAVVVSNYGAHPVSVKPEDVLLHRGKEIIDPLPVEVVLRIAKGQHWFLRAKTEQQIDDYFVSTAFTETTLLPSDSYQGVMFFSLPKPERPRETLFMMSSLFREGGPKVRIGVTDLETHDRLHFGPFSLSSQQDLVSSGYQ
jgi:hypothetical protein